MLAQYATELTPLGGSSRPRTSPPRRVFLACDDSASITGEDLNVSGGLAMH